MRLSIVIPAFNEESAIASTIEACLRARGRIMADCGVESVELIVVSDGSTDRTASIARRCGPDVWVISYPGNRGYGAAVSCGLQAASGEYVAFMDADGTLCPDDFGLLVKRLEEENADVCTGARMGKGNRMPWIRRIGNHFFRLLVWYLSDRLMDDVASGMRVLRKSSLPKLEPLPDGMSYAPAMTCRAILAPDLRITEAPVHYSERVGQSKLRAIRDGVDFLRVILDIGVIFHPLKLFALPGFVLVPTALVYGLLLVDSYFSRGHVAEDMIYRILFIVAALNCGFLFLCVGAFLENLSRVQYGVPQGDNRLLRVLLFALGRRSLAWYAVGSYALTLLVSARPLSQYLAHHSIQVHWTWVAVALLFSVSGTIALVFSLTGYAFDTMRRILTGPGPNGGGTR